MSFSRTLTFRTDKLTITGPVTIMLTFATVPSSSPVPMTQIAWRVLNFGGGNQSLSVTYAQNLLFASLQVDSGNLVTAVAQQVLSIGQQTNLEAAGAGVIFTAPVTGNPGELIATNLTGKSQGIAIGYLDPDTGLPDPLLAWQNVGNTNSVEAVYTPILKGYVTSDYEQTELITGEIVSPILLNQDLALLNPTQTYTLVKNGDGSYSLNPDANALASPRHLVGYDPAPNDYHKGKSGSIQVTNLLRFDIFVKISKSANASGDDAFHRVRPGVTESWSRSQPEVVTVNVGGHGRVAQFFGVVGKNLQIKSF